MCRWVCSGLELGSWPEPKLCITTRISSSCTLSVREPLVLQRSGLILHNKGHGIIEAAQEDSKGYDDVCLCLFAGMKMSLKWHKSECVKALHTELAIAHHSVWIFQSWINAYLRCILGLLHLLRLSLGQRNSLHIEISDRLTDTPSSHVLTPYANSCW